jgi:hypothetical protein
MMVSGLENSISVQRITGTGLEIRFSRPDTIPAVHNGTMGDFLSHSRHSAEILWR